MPAKEIKYESVTLRFLAERDAKDVLQLIIHVLERDRPGAVEEAINELYPMPEGQSHQASYTKPQ